MASSLTLGSLAALFAAMVVLAAVPSSSVLIVTARAATHGFAHGAWVSVGVVVGDLLFIALAIVGLAALVEWLGPAFVALKLVGAAYLLWMGFQLWRSACVVQARGEPAAGSWLAGLTSGLVLTLSDQKAVLFYLGFLPAFVNLAALTVGDAALIMVIATVAVGGVKLCYAAAAARTGQIVGHNNIWLPRLAGTIVVGVGLFILGATLVG